MSDPDLDELAAELAEFAAPEKKGGRPPREERIIAGFEEIQRFVETARSCAAARGRPRHLRAALCRAARPPARACRNAARCWRRWTIKACLPAQPMPLPRRRATIDDGRAGSPNLADAADADDITVLRHVRTSAEKRAAEEIADRKPARTSRPSSRCSSACKSTSRRACAKSQPIEAGRRAIEAGDFFVLDGHIAYVAEVGEPLKTTAGEVDRRLRAHLRQRHREQSVAALASTRVLQRPRRAAAGLARERAAVLRRRVGSRRCRKRHDLCPALLSDHPYVAQHRDLIHKIGVTGGKVETRIADAEHDATYLLAKSRWSPPTSWQASTARGWRTFSTGCSRPARLNITINDRFGHPVQPQEWFLVPLFVIDEAVERIKDGTITEYVYDPKTAKLVKA